MISVTLRLASLHYIREEYVKEVYVILLGEIEATPVWSIVCPTSNLSHPMGICPVYPRYL